MSAAACPNEKCYELIDFNDDTKFPFRCKQCDEQITVRHHLNYLEVMSMTKTHLDTIKMSNIACKIEQSKITEKILLIIIFVCNYDCRLGHLQCFDQETA